MSKPRVIRKVLAHYKDAKNKGKVKVAGDRKAKVKVEQIKAQKPRNCEGACIWGGTIEVNDFFARVDVGDRRYIGRRPVPITKEYHFSCLPGHAMPLRRFFQPLPYRSTLCRSEAEPLSHRNFHSISEWEAWMNTHYPTMKKHWAGGGPTWRQYGTGYRWCAVNVRPSFRKPDTY